MPPQRPHLTIFLDVVSPFAYMAFYMVRNSPVFKKCDVEYIPIFLGGVMQACGNTPPIKIKNKDAYISHDRTRLASLFSIPILPTSPPNFPPNTLPAQRALCAIQTSHPASLAPALEALYASFWVRGEDIASPSVVSAALRNVLSEQEVEGVMERVGSKEVKGLLTANTAKAIEMGAFGLPWFVARDGEGREEGFFGFDRLPMVVEHLGLGREGLGGGERALL